MDSFRTFKIEAHFTSACKTISEPNCWSKYNYSDKRKYDYYPRSYLVDNDYVIVNNDEKENRVEWLQKVEILEGLKKRKPFMYQESEL
jgi:hypothetical protein